MLQKALSFPLSQIEGSEGFNYIGEGTIATLMCKMSHYSVCKPIRDSAMKIITSMVKHFSDLLL